VKRMLDCIMVLSLLGAAGNSQAQAAKSTDLYSITISTQHSTVKVGSPIVLRIITKNVSDHVINRILISGSGTEKLSKFRIDLRDESGNLVKETPYGRTVHGTVPDRPHGGSMIIGEEPLDPGQTLDQELDLSKEYDLSRPGTYTVRLRRLDFHVKDINSNAVSITVTP
jgi:hypothetical protein